MDLDNKIQFDSISVEKTYHFFEVDTNPKCSLQVNFIYPVDYTNHELLNLIQQHFISCFFGDAYVNLPPGEAVEKYAGDFINEFKEEEKNFKIDVENHGFEMDETWYVKEQSTSGKIVYNRNDLLSFVVFKEFYFGGAHGGHQYNNCVIDLKTGRKITEDEIFINDYQDDLAKIIVDAIASSNNVEITELEDIGFFNVNEIYPNKNFFVDETGITFTYNEYDIAAYVVGAVSVQIEYAKILHLMRRDSPISEIAFR
jgi:hypothetical protein